jgi:hypothetical protein
MDMLKLSSQFAVVMENSVDEVLDLSHGVSSVLPVWRTLQNLVQAQLEGLLAEIAANEMSVGFDEIRRWQQSNDPMVLSRAISHMSSAYAHLSATAIRQKSAWRELLHQLVIPLALFAPRSNADRKASKVALLLGQLHIFEAINHENANSEVEKRITRGALNTADEHLDLAVAHFCSYQRFEIEDHSNREVAGLSGLGVPFEPTESEKKLRNDLCLEKVDFMDVYHSLRRTVAHIRTKSQGTSNAIL